MSELTISAEKRDVIGKDVKMLRSAGQVPGVIYGPITEPVVVTLDGKELQSLLIEAGGTSVVEVKIGKDTHQVLVRDVQRDIIRGKLLHVDFYAVDMTKVTRVEVPIVLAGESPIVASRAAIMMNPLTSVEVEGLPQDLVNEVVVDLDDLTEIGDTVLVSDLYVPSALTILNDPADMVVKIDYLALEEEEEEEEVLEGEESMFADDGVASTSALISNSRSPNFRAQTCWYWSTTNCRLRR